MPSGWSRKATPFQSGDILAEIETDKATMEFEAVDEGMISKILVPEGTDGVKVGTAIALMGGEGEEASAAPAPAEAAGAAPAAAPTPSDQTAEAEAPQEGRTGTTQLVKPQAVDPGIARRHRDAEADPARSAARRDGRGNAPRRSRLRDGRGSRAISGRLQGHPRPARGVRRKARDRHADHRIWFRRDRHGCGDGRAQADHRVHDLQLRHAGDRPHHQFGGQDQLHVWRPDALPDRVPRPQRRRQPRRRAAQPELCAVVRQRARPDRDRAIRCGGRQGAAQGRDPVGRSGRLPRERIALRPDLRAARGRRLGPADRQGAHHA